jgi:hypothetical protein
MVPFAKSCLKFNFSGEQFWGRAARAPRSRKRFEALVILGRDSYMDSACSVWSQVFGLRFLPKTYDLRPRTDSSVGGNREVDRDLGFGFDRFGAFQVRFEVPLPDRVLGC